MGGMVSYRGLKGFRGLGLTELARHDGGGGGGGDGGRAGGGWAQGVWEGCM